MGLPTNGVPNRTLFYLVRVVNFPVANLGVNSADKWEVPMRTAAPLRRRSSDEPTIFETYVETQLVPTLRRGDVVIRDNLAAHKSQKAEQMVRAKGACCSSCHPTIEMALPSCKRKKPSAASTPFGKPS